MIRKSLIRKSLVIATGIVLSGSFTGDFVWAGSGQYARSTSPYWHVGQYNDTLSEACQRNFFNQKKIQNLNIGYHGDRGMGVTGIATRDWNLRDPMGLAKPNITYHFFNDGYSNCKVYVAKVRPRRGGAD